MRKKLIKEGIPQFGLYGESSFRQKLGFVHIEDIVDRSSVNSWHIKPHRHGKLYQILCMYEGELDVTLDEKSHSLSGSWVITIPSDVVHGFRFHPATQGIVLTLDEELLKNEESQASAYVFNELIHHSQVIQFSKNGRLLSELVQYLNLIRGELQSLEEGHDFMLVGLVKSVLMTLKRQFDQRQQNNHKHSGNNTLLAFRALLEENYLKHWTVQEYADALYISVSTLNRLCNSIVHLSAKTIIKDRLLVEAKRKLIYTHDPLDQIAYTLGFKDPAYFSRFFKTNEGLAPRDYRHSKNS